MKTTYYKHEGLDFTQRNPLYINVELKIDHTVRDGINLIHKVSVKK